MFLRNKREFEFLSFYLFFDVFSLRDLGSLEYNVNVFYFEDMSIEELSMVNVMCLVVKNYI